MNKKFLSAILFGALMVTSTGTFVSCKDYDDDIENLQSQINNLATKSDVEAKLSQLQAAVEAAKAEALKAAASAEESAEIAALEAKIDALGKCECNLEAMKKEIQDAVDADMAGYKTEIEALVEQVEALVGEVADFVTSVELDYMSNNNALYWLDFFTITEKENVFEEGLTGALSFTKDKQTQVAKNGIVVRVNPTNAVLTPEMISLVNSKGENLDEYVDIKVEKYAELVTRGASNNGLWKVTPVLKEYNKDKFAALKYADVKKGDVSGNYISYAIQINNALESAEARYVTSPYAIQLDEWSPFVGNNGLYFTVDNVLVEDINNRFDASSKSLPNFSATKTPMYEELVWLNKTNSSANGPAATEMITKGEDINVAKAWDWIPDGPHSVGDNRSEKPVALAVQGKPMTIAITDGKYGKDDDDYEGKIAGLYVTLDYEANAVESAPSEWNAWNSYDIKGLNQVVKGTSTTITIDGKGTINDYIGFRVYAVNLDGTLVDPDGRAFYVLVGEQAAEAQTIVGTLKPTNDVTTHSSIKVALTAAQQTVLTSILSNKNFDASKTVFEMAENKPVAVDKDGNEYPVAYEVTYNWKDDKVVEAVFTLTQGTTIKSLIDGQTYKASAVYKNKNGHVLGEVNFELNKELPTAFPADFAFRPKQEVEDGTGKFIAYMIPEANNYVVPTPFATTGIKELNNVFYGLDEYYKFSFAESNKNADKELISVVVTANAKEEYWLNIGAGYIDNATAHAVSVWYTYPGISTKKHAEKDYYLVGEAAEVAYGKTLEATYACWENASTFAWGTKTVDKEVVSLKPVLKWTAEGLGDKANLTSIVSDNTYNDDYFGLDLKALLVTKNWLAIADKDAAGNEIKTIKLVAGTQVNPYFVPTIEGDLIKFTQANTQVDSAPVADHEETLVITLVDAFGHQVVVSMDVTVKAPVKE